MIYDEGRPKADDGLGVDEEDGVDATVVLGVVGHLSIFSPDNFAPRGNKAQLADVHLDNGSLCDDTKGGIHGTARVLLDANHRQTKGGLSNNRLHKADRK